MPRFVAINAPTELGLRRETPGRPTGVVRLPAVLRQAGLCERLGVARSVDVPVPYYVEERDPQLGVLNPQAIRVFSFDLAAAVEPVVRSGDFPLGYEGPQLRSSKDHRVQMMPKGYGQGRIKQAERPASVSLGFWAPQCV